MTMPILRVVKWIAPFLFALSLYGTAAADGCAKSRDYILEGMAGDLTRPSKAYQDLYRACVEAIAFPNVKDAYVLKAGVIAIDPTRNTVMATAATLSQFCQRFPDRSVRFFTPAEQRRARTVGLVVMMSATNATSCKAIRG
jgi:hypothetical protein